LNCHLHIVVVIFHWPVWFLGETQMPQNLSSFLVTQKQVLCALYEQPATIGSTRIIFHHG